MTLERQKIIKLPRVKEITTLSRATIYRQMDIGKFPKQAKLAERACAWVEQEVLDWLDSRIEDRHKSDDE
jgi:prophage regulatory protein